MVSQINVIAVSVCQIQKYCVDLAEHGILFCYSSV